MSAEGNEQFQDERFNTVKIGAVTMMLVRWWYYYTTMLKLYLYIINGTCNLDEKEDTALCMSVSTVCACMWVCVFMYGAICILTPLSIDLYTQYFLSSFSCWTWSEKTYLGWDRCYTMLSRESRLHAALFSLVTVCFAFVKGGLLALVNSQSCISFPQSCLDSASSLGFFFFCGRVI